MYPFEAFRIISFPVAVILPLSSNIPLSEISGRLSFSRNRFSNVIISRDSLNIGVADNSTSFAPLLLNRTFRRASVTRFLSAAVSCLTIPGTSSACSVVSAIFVSSASSSVSSCIISSETPVSPLIRKLCASSTIITEPEKIESICRRSSSALISSRLSSVSGMSGSCGSNSAFLSFVVISLCQLRTVLLNF